MKLQQTQILTLLTAAVFQTSSVSIFAAISTKFKFCFLLADAVLSQTEEILSGLQNN